MATAAPGDIVHTRVCDALAHCLGPKKYGLWFDGRAIIGIKDHVLRVRVPNRFQADWIERNYKGEIREAAIAALGQGDWQVSIVVDAAAFPKRQLQSEPGRAAGEMQPRPQVDGPRAVITRNCATFSSADSTSTWTGRPGGVITSGGPAATNRHSAGGAFGSYAAAGSSQAMVDARYDLDAFVVGPCNELAWHAAVRLAQGERGFNLLFVHGDCGLGKSHLLRGICRQTLLRHPHARVRCITGEEFTTEYVTAVKANKVDRFRKGVRHLDLLAIDDVHFLSQKQATQNEFLSTFNAMDLSGARLVLASDNHPQRIAAFSQNLVSRFMAGMVVEVEQPDRETRVRLIRALAARRGLRLNDGAVERLADHCVGSVRDIEGALTQLAAISELSRRTRRAATALTSPIREHLLFADRTTANDQPTQGGDRVDADDQDATDEGSTPGSPAAQAGVAEHADAVAMHEAIAVLRRNTPVRAESAGVARAALGGDSRASADAADGDDDLRRPAPPMPRAVRRASPDRDRGATPSEPARRDSDWSIRGITDSVHAGRPVAGERSGASASARCSDREPAAPGGRSQDDEHSDDGSRCGGRAEATAAAGDGRGDDSIGAILIDRMLRVSNQSDRSRKPIQPGMILAEVSAYFAISVPDILCESKHRQLVAARSIAAYLIRHLTTLSFPETARAMQRRNHSTIVAQVKRIQCDIDMGATIRIERDNDERSVRTIVDTLADRVQRRRETGDNDQPAARANPAGSVTAINDAVPGARASRSDMETRSAPSNAQPGRAGRGETAVRMWRDPSAVGGGDPADREDRGEPVHLRSASSPVRAGWSPDGTRKGLGRARRKLD